LDVSAGRVYISRDDVFDEKVFSFAHLHPNAGALLKKEFLLLPSSTSSLHEGAYTGNDHMSPVVHVTNVQQDDEVAEENSFKTVRRAVQKLQLKLTRKMPRPAQNTKTILQNIL
jgi:hypothetical protein